MRRLLILLLVGCGSHGSDDSGPSAPEVTELNIIKLCNGEKCTLAIKGTYSDGLKTLTAPNTLVIEAITGLDKPGPCTAASRTDGKDSVIIEGVSNPAFVYLRGCVFNGKIYSPGLTGTVVTP